MKKQKHQSYWEEDLTEEECNRWLGDTKSLCKTYAMDYIKQKGFKSLIDCGAGIFTQYDLMIEKKMDLRYVATEITEKFVNLGIEKGIEIYHCSVEKMNVPDQHCEIAMCIAVLNHQTDFKDSIAELLRIAEKEVIISFFKPFLEDRNGIGEIKKSINKFPIIKVDKNVGLSIQRHEKFIYTFFRRNAIKTFLDNLPVRYIFHPLEDKTMMLHIIKEGTL